MKSILCVEDNPEVRILVESALDSYNVVHATTLAEANKQLGGSRFSLVILDLELPDGDGMKFLTGMSQSADWRALPIFILTAKSDTANKILAFSVGADDFISKPFDPLELRARVNAKIRKSETSQDNADTVKVGSLTISIPNQTVSIAAAGRRESVDLTSLEFRLLLTFARAPERVFSRERLLDEVWGRDTHITDRTVDTHIAHLRKKITDSNVRIETVVGEGYRLVIGP